MTALPAAEDQQFVREYLLADLLARSVGSGSSGPPR